MLTLKNKNYGMIAKPNYKIRQEQKKSILTIY